MLSSQLRGLGRYAKILSRENHSGRAEFFSLAEASENSPQFKLRVCVQKINQAPAGRQIRKMIRRVIHFDK